MNKLLIAKDANEAKKLSRLSGQKKIRRIYRGIYTDNLRDPIENIVRSHWMGIVSHIVTGGILSFRTAVDLKPTSWQGQRIVFITSTYAKTITLPGLVIKVVKGNNKDYIEQILPGLARSSTSRMLLENLTAVRGKAYRNIKTITVEGVENYLAKELRVYDEARLNQIRDEAKEIAPVLGYSAEYERLDNIISALLSTHPDTDYLSSKSARAVANRKPYDSKRLRTGLSFLNTSSKLAKSRSSTSSPLTQ